MSLLDNPPHRCTIGLATRISDAFGGNVYGIEVQKVDVECWEQPVSDSESKAYQKKGQSVTTKIYFSENPNLTEQHRILITERLGIPTSNLDISDVGNPDTLSVVSTAQPDASVGLGVLFRIMCNSLTGETQ